MGFCFSHLADALFGRHNLEVCNIIHNKSRLSSAAPTCYLTPASHHIMKTKSHTHSTGDASGLLTDLLAAISGTIKASGCDVAADFGHIPAHTIYAASLHLTQSGLVSMQVTPLSC